MDGADQGAAELLAVELRLEVGGLLVEEVAGAEAFVAESSEERAVELVRSRLGDDVDDRPDRAPALRRPAVLQDLELLYGLVGEVLQEAPDHVVLVVAAVHVHVELATVAAAEADVADARLGRVEVADGTRLGRDDGETGEGAVNQRQLAHLGRRDAAPQFRGGRLYERGLGRNLDGLA